MTVWQILCAPILEKMLSNQILFIFFVEEKLNTFSKETLIQLFLAQQEQLSEIDKKLQLVLEQLAVMNQNRYGRKTEQMPVPQQMAFADVNGELVMFNEAEALASLDENKEGLTVAGCWAHARRRYEEAVKALPAKSRKSNIVWQALEQIRMIYHVDNTLKELTPEERKERRQESVKPLVEAYFVWVKEKKKEGRIAEKSKT